MPKANIIGERLRWLRNSNYITLRQFAARVGCDAGYLSKLESGKADNPSDRFLMSVVVTFRVSLKWLRSGTGDPYGKCAEDQETRESLSDWSPERVARVMAVLDDLQAALATDRVLATLLPDISLEQVQVLWHEVRGLGLPVTARLFWNDAFMGFQFQAEERDRVPKNKLLTNTSPKSRTGAVKIRTLNDLLAALKSLASEPGRPAALARDLNVPQARVSEWLSGKKKPGGETTFRLLEWLQAEEAKQKRSSGRATTHPGRKTQVRKSSYEEQTQFRKKEWQNRCCYTTKNHTKNRTELGKCQPRLH